MSDRSLAVCLVLSGICLGVFWALTLPFDGFAGAHVAKHPLFVPGQCLHLVGAILGVLGYFAIYFAVRGAGAILAFVAVLTGVCGMTLFAGDAVLALIVFPVVADTAPNMLAPDGAMFTGRALAFYISTYVIHMCGILLLCLAVVKARRVSFAAIGAFGVGGVVMNLPPIPGWHVLAVAGGMLFGLGAAWIGWQLIVRAHQPEVG